jgi:hypothetical protein
MKQLPAIAGVFTRKSPANGTAGCKQFRLQIGLW